MKTKIPFIILILLVFFLFILISYKKPLATKKFITNKTVEKSEDIFFMYETIKYPALAYIKGLNNDSSDVKVGISGETWHLNFGFIPVGINQVKFFDLYNPRDIEIKVDIVTYGNISSIVSFDKNNFIIKPNETTKISIFLNTSKVIVPGEYVGEVDLNTIKPKYKFLSQILWRSE
jgi:hypothetical protein